jgi:parallel beta-helix repeat protein
MDSMITRKDFCKNLAMSSVAAVAYPAPPVADASDATDKQSRPALGVTGQSAPFPRQDLVISVKDYGARGDGVADDTQPIQRAMQSNALIFFPAGNYLVSKTIVLRSLQNIHIWAIGATLINNTLTNHCFQVDQCEFVTITGGKYTRSAKPDASWPTSYHCFFLTDSKDLVVQNVFIDGSPGMGIAIGSAANVKILNNTIKNTLRDGIYSHYSVNVLYSGNYLENIKDDALSMHDYGFNRDKQTIIALGYPQAGSSIIANNRIKNAMRGIGSIGLQTLTITGNVIEHVVNCGIEVYNTAESFEGPDTQVRDVVISNNLISYACLRSLYILGKLQGDNNQGGGGKAAITVGSIDADVQYKTENKRLSNISVTENMVNYSAADAYFLNNIDGLIFSNNSARNCNTSPFPPYTGYIVECWSCTGLCGFNNNVIDSNSPPTAIAGYRVRNTTGSIGGWLGSEYVVDPISKTTPKVLY